MFVEKALHQLSYGRFPESRSTVSRAGQGLKPDGDTFRPERLGELHALRIGHEGIMGAVPPIQPPPWMWTMSGRGFSGVASGR